MNIQIFGASKSFDTRKAERWFKERRIKYQYIDLRSKGLSAGEYRSVKAAVGWDALVDRDSVRQAEGEAVLDRSFGGSLPSFLAAFLRAGRVSDRDAEEIERMLEEYRKNK